MENGCDIKKICAAQASLYPDGGYASLHRVRHRSLREKICDFLRRERLAIAITLCASFAASLLLFALSSPRVTTLAADAAVSAVRGAASTEEGRRRLREEYDTLPPAERLAVDELLGR